MPHTLAFLSRANHEQFVVLCGARLGYRLVQCDTESGESWWEWRAGDAPHPQFVSRGRAIAWMRGRLSESLSFTGS